MLFCYAKKTQWRQVRITFELQLNIEWQGPVQNILLLWFIQGIFSRAGQVQQLLLLPSTPELSLVVELYYAVRHLTLQRSIGSNIPKILSLSVFCPL